MSRSNQSLNTLEGFIDTAYDNLANQNKALSSSTMADVSASHLPSCGPSPLEDHNSSDSADQSMTMQPQSSTPDLGPVTRTVNTAQQVNPSTPAALDEGIRHGFFPDLLGKFTGASKKRKVISPVTGIDGHEITLDEENTKVAEVVYQSVVASMSDLLEDYRTQLSFQFGQMETEMRATVEEALMRDALDKETVDDEGEVAALRDEVSKLREQLSITIGRVTRAEKQVQEMNEEMLQMQARMMRDNLVFYNIKEGNNESSADCTNTLRSFLRDEMKIDKENMAKIKFDRVHRMGQKGGKRSRPIVAKLNPFEGKGIVMAHIKNLDKNKKFGINDQLPRELEERKKQLLPKFKEAKRQDRKPKWSVDKLVVGKNVTQVRKDHVKDINVDTTEAATQIRVNHAPPKTYRNSTFRGHNVPVQTQDDIIPALHAIERVSRATHNIYAYRLQTGSGVVEHFEDDGEWGAGRVLLKLLRDNDITGKLVCVTRWYGGEHLGRARFDYTVEAAKATLQI